jgi:hypothetical protein
VTLKICSIVASMIESQACAERYSSEPFKTRWIPVPSPIDQTLLCTMVSRKILLDELRSNMTLRSTRSLWSLQRITTPNLSSLGTTPRSLEMEIMLRGSLKRHSSAKFRTWNVSRHPMAMDYLQLTFPELIWTELETFRMVQVSFSVRTSSEWGVPPNFSVPSVKTCSSISQILCLRIRFSTHLRKYRKFGILPTLQDR